MFKNLSNGYLETSSNNFSVEARKFKLRQINDKADGYIQNNPDDRSDLIVLDSIFRLGTLTIYLNDNNNSFNFASPFAVVHPGYAIFDFEIADMDNDGFNDLIIAGVDNPVNGSFYYARVYKNYDGVTLGSTPIWSIESTDYIRSFPHIAIDDISKDGFNDLIIVSDGGYSNVFINTKNTPILGTSPDQIFSINSNESANIWQVKIADIYNTGGKALFTSFQSVGFGLTHLLMNFLKYMQ